MQVDSSSSASEASEAHQVMIRTILHTVETAILPSAAAKEFFQRMPFSGSGYLREAGGLPAYNSDFANGFLHGVILPFLARDPTTASCVGFITGMTFGHQKQLWKHQGLGNLVHKAHCLWRQRYGDSIQRAVDIKLGKASNTLTAAREIFSATEQEHTSRLPFYKGIQDILLTLYTCPERATGTALRADHNNMSKLLDALHGKLNRDVYTKEEEAFVLVVIRKYLLSKYGRSVYAVLAPGTMLLPLPLVQPFTVTDNQSLTAIPAVLAPAPTLPDIMDAAEDVAATAQMEPQDVDYHGKLCESLDQQEALVESSVMFSFCNVFATLPSSLPSPGGNNSSGSSDDEEGSASASSSSSSDDDSSSSSSSSGSVGRRGRRSRKSATTKDRPSKGTTSSRRKPRFKLRQRKSGATFSSSK